MNKEQLILRYLGNELSPEEIVYFEEWVKTSTRNQERLDELKEVWDKTENYPKGFHPDTAKAIEKIHHAAGIKQYGGKVVRLRPWMFRIAASVLLFVGVFGIYRLLNMGEKQIIITTDNSHIKEVVLPDNTHVWLNKNSKLTYPEKFSEKSRVVYLSGEGYFEVYKNPYAPFYVKLKSSEVKVLGTHFNIRTFQNESYSSVTVAEGRVMFSVTDTAKQSVILMANESAVLNNTSLTIHKAEQIDLNYMAWKTNVLEFYNTSLGEAIKIICFHFNLKYKAINKNILDVHINGRFKNKPAYEILNSLSAATNTRITMQNDTIFVH